MYTSSEHSSSSDGSSGSEGAHPLDAVISQRHNPPPQPQGNPKKRARPSPSPEPVIHITDGRDRASESESESDPESGELEEVAEDFDDVLADASDSPSTNSESAEQSGDPDQGTSSDGGGPPIVGDKEAAPAVDKGDVAGEDARAAAALGGSGEGTILAARANRPAVTRQPTGVILYEEGNAPDRSNAELERLLRAPRYFDTDFTEAGPRCFKCGGKGHFARDCSAPPRERACFLCAGFGHDSRECPNSLCWRCNRTGHMARDCPYGSNGPGTWDEGPVVCMRCGREDCPCAGERDFVRAEGGCTNAYLESDLRRARCFVCDRFGHLSCALESKKSVKPSCYNCGQGGHTGEECKAERPQVMKAERRGSGRHPSGVNTPKTYGSGGGGGYSSYGGNSRGGYGSDRSGYGRDRYGSSHQQQRYGDGEYGAYSGGDRWQPDPYSGGGGSGKSGKYRSGGDQRGRYEGYEYEADFPRGGYNSGGGYSNKRQRR